MVCEADWRPSPLYQYCQKEEGTHATLCANVAVVQGGSRSLGDIKASDEALMCRRDEAEIIPSTASLSTTPVGTNMASRHGWTKEVLKVDAKTPHQVRSEVKAFPASEPSAEPDEMEVDSARKAFEPTPVHADESTIISASAPFRDHDASHSPFAFSPSAAPSISGSSFSAFMDDGNESAGTLSPELFSPSPSTRTVPAVSPVSSRYAALLPDSEFFISTGFQSSRRLTPPVSTSTADISSPNSIMAMSENVTSVGSDRTRTESPGNKDGDGVTAKGLDNKSTRGASVASSDREDELPVSRDTAPLDVAMLSPRLDERHKSPSPIDIASIGTSSLSKRHETRRHESIALDPRTLVRLQNIDLNRSTVQATEDIEELIEVGVQHLEDITWRANTPEHAEETLSHFRPGTWLNDDAITEVLYRLAVARSDVHVVESHEFAAAYSKHDTDRIRRWKSPTLILIPVHLASQQHWFLVSIQCQRGKIVVHENRSRKSTHGS